ncbi:MAG: DUF3298 domain-containing protein [Bacteroidales bacterium]|nr:DUF3298 domain-containing protein [Bacteroidales bacterium]
MNRKLLVIAVAALLSVSVSCNRAKKADKMAETLTFQSAKFDTIVNLVKGDPNSPKSTINIDLIYAIGPNASQINEEILKSGILPSEDLKRGEKKTVPRALEIFVKNYVKGYKEDCLKAYKEDPEGVYEYEFKVESQISYGRDSIINYRASQYDFSGGAHGENSTFVMNFDKNTGRIITKKDVFKPESEDKVAELVMAQICKKYDAADLDELFEKESIDIEKPFIPDLFTLGTSGITFIFLEAELGPHSAGEIQVTVPYEDLKGMIQ